jgi:hypothetical protein
MPGFLLHKGAQVTCIHQGQAQPMVVSQRVKVGGQGVVRLADTYTISGCTAPPPPAGIPPCVSATWLMGALRVKVENQPVILFDSRAICSPIPTPLLIQQTQQKVKGQ